MREVELVPEALAELRGVRERNPLLGERLDLALDLVEEEPPNVRAKRRALTSDQVDGFIFAIEVRGAGEDWLILWGENASNPSSPLVFYVGKNYL